MNTPTTTTINTTVRLPRRRRNRNRNARAQQRPGQQGGGQPPVNKPTTKRQGVTLPDLLSPCARDYLSVLLNPYSGKVACVPSLPSIPSRKVRYWAKGVGVTGTNQFGFVAFNPFNFTNDVGGEDQNAIYASASTFAGTQTDYDSTATGVTVAQLNSEYSGGTASTFKYKLVAAGLRVRYSGTELNRGGRMFCLEEPDHADTDSFSLSNISRYDTHRVFRPDQRWKSVTYHPADEDEFDYYTFSQRPTSKFMLIAIESPGLIAISFEYEAVAIYEVIGSAVRGLTPTPVDLVGLSAVQTFTNTTNNVAPREGDRSSFVHYALNETGKLLWEMGSGVAKAYFARPPPSKLGLTLTEPMIEYVE